MNDVIYVEGCIECRVSLIIYPGDHDPALITQILGIEPTETARKGEKIGPNSLGKVRIVQNSLWDLTSDKELRSLSLDEHLDWMLKKLSPATQQLQQVKAMNGVDIRVSCVWWTNQGGGFVLDKKLIKEFSQHDLDLEFDIRAFME